MSWRRILEKYLRGWLPKDPVMPDNRLRNMRKPVTVLVTVTLLVASVSLIYTYTLFSQTTPVVLPKPLPSATPTSQPTPSLSSSPFPTLSATPAQSASPTSTTSTTSPQPTPSRTLNPTANPTPIPTSQNPTSTPTPFISQWATVEDVGTARQLTYYYWSPTIYNPTEATNLFLVLKFSLTAPNQAYPINVSDIRVIVDGDAQYSPCGYSLAASIATEVYRVGSFIGTITAAGVDFGGNTYSSISDFIFVYEIPEQTLSLQRSFELKVTGSQMGYNFTVPLPLPTPVPSPTPTPAPTPPPANTAWSKSYGGAGNDVGYSVVPANNGGFVVAGYTDSFGQAGDMWLVKTDANGNEQWSKNYGGSSADGGYSVISAGDGGYAVAGYTRSYGAGGSDMWLVKTDSQGNMQWSKTYGGAADELASSIVRASDGGYVIAGYTKSINSEGSWIYLVKTDASGNMQWNKTYGGGIDDMGYCVIQTKDGGYAFVGKTLVKTDANGKEQWQQAYSSSSADRGFSLVQTSEGGFAITGYYDDGAGSHHPPADCPLLIKTDANGNIQWNRHYGRDWAWATPNPSWPDETYSVIQTDDGGYAMIGHIRPTSGVESSYLARIDADGNVMWSIIYGGANVDSGNCLLKTGNGGFVVAGSTNSNGAGNNDVWLVRIDPR